MNTVRANGSNAIHTFPYDFGIRIALKWMSVLGVLPVAVFAMLGTTRVVIHCLRSTNQCEITDYNMLQNTVRIARLDDSAIVRTQASRQVRRGGVQRELQLEIGNQYGTWQVNDFPDFSQVASNFNRFRAGNSGDAWRLDVAVTHARGSLLFFALIAMCAFISHTMRVDVLVHARTVRIVTYHFLLIRRARQFSFSELRHAFVAQRKGNRGQKYDVLVLQDQGFESHEINIPDAKHYQSRINTLLAGQPILDQFDDGLATK